MATENIAGKIDLDKIPEKIPASKQAETPASLERGPSLNIEKITSPEKIQESSVEKTTEKISSNLPPVGGQALSFHNQRAQEIDNILSAGLHDIFLKMKPQEQQEFKRVGEETTIKIVAMLDKGKVKVSKIIELIKKWLKIIPGINKFFLEQEAKIKADKIMHIK
jgi:hypothetical protein